MSVQETKPGPWESPGTSHSQLCPMALPHNPEEATYLSLQLHFLVCKINPAAPVTCQCPQLIILTDYQAGMHSYIELHSSQNKDYHPHFTDEETEPESNEASP